MIIACVAEFYQEEVHEYRERSFRIVQGNASNKDLGKADTSMHSSYEYGQRSDSENITKIRQTYILVFV